MVRHNSTSSFLVIAAEMEVETAALYHSELWFEIEDLKNSSMDINKIEK